MNKNFDDILNCRVFHESKCLLGEGLYVDRVQGRVWWLDIKQSKVFAKTYDDAEVLQFTLSEMPGAILDVIGGIVVICAESGLLRLEKETGAISSMIRMPTSAVGKAMRANDGIRSISGMYWFGTMEKYPTGPNGKIYMSDGVKIQQVADGIGVPNSFIEMNDSDLLISDSFRQVIRRFRISESGVELCYVNDWYDFSATKMAPDGGCFGPDGFIYVALWDGAGIAKFDIEGKLLRILKLPVLRPTNCKFASDGRLFVTSAREGLSDAQLDKYPLSGSVLVLESKDWQ